MSPLTKLSTEARISALERQWADAFLRKDVPALQRLMADGYMLIIAVENLPLQVVPRNAWLQRLSDFDVKSVTIDFIHVRLFGDVAVVMMLWNQQATLRGLDRSAELMLTDIWVQQDGEWRLAERHSSRPEGPAAARPESEALACELC